MICTQRIDINWGAVGRFRWRVHVQSGICCLRNWKPWWNEMYSNICCFFLCIYKKISTNVFTLKRELTQPKRKNKEEREEITQIFNRMPFIRTSIDRVHGQSVNKWKDQFIKLLDKKSKSKWVYQIDVSYELVSTSCEIKRQKTLCTWLPSKCLNRFLQCQELNGFNIYGSMLIIFS